MNRVKPLGCPGSILIFKEVWKGSKVEVNGTGYQWGIWDFKATRGILKEVAPLLGGG